MEIRSLDDYRKRKRSSSGNSYKKDVAKVPSELEPHLEKNCEIQMEINVNGKRAPAMPRLDINRQTDVLVVNGLFIYADYMDVFEDCLAFFLEGNPEPIIIQFSQDKAVRIDIEEDGSGNRLIEVSC